VETGLASGWHVSHGGATYGPYEWNDLVAWAQGGRLAPETSSGRRSFPAGSRPGRCRDCSRPGPAPRLPRMDKLGEHLHTGDDGRS